MKTIEDDTNKWKDIQCSWIERIDIAKISILPKVVYKFNTIPIKIPIILFIKLEQIIPKFMWNHKRSQVVKAILKNNKVGGAMLSNFKVHYKAIVFKTV